MWNCVLFKERGVILGVIEPDVGNNYFDRTLSYTLLLLLSRNISTLLETFYALLGGETVISQRPRKGARQDIEFFSPWHISAIDWFMLGAVIIAWHVPMLYFKVVFV